MLYKHMKQMEATKCLVCKQKKNLCFIYIWRLYGTALGLELESVVAHCFTDNCIEFLEKRVVLTGTSVIL